MVACISLIRSSTGAWTIALAVAWSSVTSLAGQSDPVAARPGHSARVDGADRNDHTERLERIDFNRDIRPILAGRCFTCHGPDPKKRKGGARDSDGLRLDTLNGQRADLGGHQAVVPRHPDVSELLRRVRATNRHRMPPPSTGGPLPPEEIDRLERWIAEGAEFARHWSFAPLSRPIPPPTRDQNWPRNPIDHFVAARLDRAGLRPASAADRATLIRRVAFDLTGLPPTSATIERFRADRQPGAYERLVDRLLASPTYGEHMTRHWLDLARYADTAGYANDPKRTIWAYRDWVIRAFNDNLHFDEFTIAQLAGDLLPNPTQDQLIATAFHRNTMTNSEGGTDDEEFRSIAVVDRVNTTMAVWTGTTMACAQCHDHKYDPFSQADYYRLYAFFNNTEDRDKSDERPTLPVLSQQNRRRQAQWEAEIATLQHRIRTDTPAIRERREAWTRSFPRDVHWQEVAARPTGEKARYRLVPTLAPGLAPITALRVAGRQLSATSLSVIPRPRRTPVARFVRITLLTEDQFLCLAEVEIFHAGENLARDARATQSSSAFGGAAGRAIDGNTDGDYSRGKSTSHTSKQSNPWWEADLGTDQPIERIVVWNRTDKARNRLRDFRLELFDAARRPVWSKQVRAVPEPSVELSLLGVRKVPVSTFQTHTSGSATVAILGETPSLHDTRLVIDLAGVTTDSIQATDSAAFTPFRGLPENVLAALATPPARRTNRQTETLVDRYREIAHQETRQAIAILEKQIADLEPMTSVPILRQLIDENRRTTHVLIRGNFLNKSQEVREGVPAALHPLHHEGRPDRLALARWLVHEDNPLTARVTVNRFWELLFGTGLVATSEDFGSRGDLPSHPRLLDWLAREFLRTDWDVKACLRLIVTSATYRQDSRTSAAMRKRDPMNRLLARGPRRRLSAEMIRDQALAIAGLLSPKMFGPPVRPPRPNLGLKAAFGKSTDWQDSTGEDRYRRGIYTFWQRSIPYPSMASFDAPSREVCTLRREPTNTPLQALVTLNDPVYVEAAQALARRIMRQGGATTEDRAAFGFRACLVRTAKTAEVARLVNLVDKTKARFRGSPRAALALATKPLGPAPKDLDIVDLAAWTVAANVLLNLDEVLVKR